MISKGSTPILTYPWPCITSSLEDALLEEEITWLDSDYDFLSDAAREKYKQHDLANLAVFVMPYIRDYERLRPAARYVLWLSIFDDYYELCPVNELALIRDRYVNVILGKEPNSNDIGLLRQVAQFRKEVLNFMPSELLERVAMDFHDYVTYGMMEEYPLKLIKPKRYPSLIRLLSIREYAIGMYPYFHMVDLAISYALPRHIYIHPVIKHIKRLLSLILMIQNDFASLKRDAVRETEIMNIVLVIQHENKISQEDAYFEAIRLHDAYVAEAVALHRNLPNFGSDHAATDDYICHMELTVASTNKFYYSVKTKRFAPYAYPEPEYEIPLYKTIS
ncbi:terpene synthase family protein [Glaciimonas immobilis]|uniref:Terpene synthase n=1 Tax=Glaciimonas immobilis TaxID=728004 RepID=A0A840RR74_9BURK|nr:terpene synthase family protein [Glaciimonas immobilis]KAF3999472.1 hypothetical protein HAV38_06030 [Glaciimonas immobilis]MBB5198989.1 hypothetical protein [Glaciimonas immobilis]